MYNEKEYFRTVINDIQNDENKQLQYYNKIYNMLNCDADQLVGEKNIYKIFYEGEKKYVPIETVLLIFDIS